MELARPNLAQWDPAQNLAEGRGLPKLAGDAGQGGRETCLGTGPPEAGGHGQQASPAAPTPTCPPALATWFLPSRTHPAHRVPGVCAHGCCCSCTPFPGETASLSTPHRTYCLWVPLRPGQPQHPAPGRIPCAPHGRSHSPRWKEAQETIRCSRSEREIISIQLPRKPRI